MIDVVARQPAYEALTARLLQVAPPNWVDVRFGVQAAGVGSAPELLGVTLAAVNLGSQRGFGQVDQEPVTYDLTERLLVASAPVPRPIVRARRAPHSYAR